MNITHHTIGHRLFATTNARTGHLRLIAPFPDSRISVTATIKHEEFPSLLAAMDRAERVDVQGTMTINPNDDPLGIFIYREDFSLLRKIIASLEEEMETSHD